MASSIIAEIEALEESPTLALNAQAIQLSKTHADFINLSIGEPDIQPPDHVKDAVLFAMKAGKNRYTPVGGTLELRQTIAKYFSEKRNIPTLANNVMATNGCKQAIFNALFVTLRAGDEVIIPAPYWMPYSEVTSLRGAKPIVVDTTGVGQGKLTVERLLLVLSAKTRWLILNSPNNPSGSVYSKSELIALGELLKQFPEVLVLSDEIYSFFDFSNEMSPCFLEANPHMVDQTVIVDGVSKFLGVTGWRLGYCRASPKMIEAMIKLQSQSTSNPCSLSQEAAIAGLNGSLDFVECYRQTLKKRAEFAEGLLQAANLSYIKPQGAFYIFINIRDQIKALQCTDNEFCQRLLQQQHLALSPGTSFGTPGFVRLSLTGNEELLSQAIQRLTSALN